MKSELQPRDYQIEAFNNIRKSFAKGNKHICLFMVGGSGKSLLCKMIIDSAIKKGGKVGFFSFRKSLTTQIKEYFKDTENVDIGTLQKMGKQETLLYDLVIIDEKDFASTKLRNNIKSKYSIVMSGCPTDSSGNVLPFDDIVEGIQYSKLLEKGYAKDIKVYSISTVNTSSLKKVNGDFDVKQSFDLMNKPKVTKDIIETYKKYCIGRKNLLFAVSIEHSEQLKNEFLEAGILCDTVHSKKNNGTLIKDFESGKFDLLINVAQISIGVDIPCVNSIIFARPLLSMPLFYQIVWRGTRKFNDDYCLVLDLADVINRVGVHPKQDIDLKKSKQDTSKTCKCGLKMKISDRSIIPVNDFEYISRTDYKCECGLTDYVENLKLINLEVCAGCGETFKSNGIVLNKNDKGLSFDLTCICGESKPFRTIEYSNEELKEIELNNAFNGAKWDDVKVILRSECKKCNYKWQYSDRLLESLKNKCSKPSEAIDKIKTVLRQNKKISALMYL